MSGFGSPDEAMPSPGAESKQSGQGLDEGDRDPADDRDRDARATTASFGRQEACGATWGGGSDVRRRLAARLPVTVRPKSRRRASGWVKKLSRPKLGKRRGEGCASKSFYDTL